MDLGEVRAVARDLHEAGNRVFEGSGPVHFRTLWQWQERLERAINGPESGGGE